MAKYAVYFLIVILVADHLYTHYAPPLINSVASFFEGKRVEIVKEDKNAKSLIDKILERIKENL